MHYNDVIMGVIASQITSNTTIHLTICSRQNQRNTKAPRHWPFMRGIHRRPVNSPRTGPVMRKMFPFDDVIMYRYCLYCCHHYISFLLIKPSLKLGHGWVIISHFFTWTELLIHALIPMLIWLSSVNKPCFGSLPYAVHNYRKVSNIRRTKSQNLNASRLILY